MQAETLAEKANRLPYRVALYVLYAIILFINILLNLELWFDIMTSLNSKFYMREEII